MASHQGPVPRVVNFAYRDYKSDATKRSATCNVCGTHVTDGPNTTSNFVRHLKAHEERYKAYQDVKTRRDDTKPISSFFTSSSPAYGSTHAKQRSITQAIISDLIIDCAMPLSIIENESFRHFLSVVDSRYQPVSRSTVSLSIGEMVATQRATIKSRLENTAWVSATVDIWSDRRMRGYLGITAHTIGIDKSDINLRSYLLACDRFTGSHTGEKISDAFEAICDEYVIKNKLDYILCDNASNMKKAFTVCFPQTDGSEKVDGGDPNDLDDSSLWEQLDEEAQDDVDRALTRNCRKQRLQCFTHTLQLTVSDGLKETKSINLVMGKASKLCTLLHTSCTFQEAFEKVYGPNKGIPAVVCTRWNSTLRQVKALTGLDHQSLSDLLEAQGHNQLKFTAREWSQLQELVMILEPFMEATNLAQGEHVVTISVVLPCILSLNRHLQDMSLNVRYLTTLVRALRESLWARFVGIFCTVGMKESPNATSDLPYGDPVYLTSSVIDPAFCLMWVEQDVLVSEDEKADLMKRIKDSVLAQASEATIVPVPLESKASATVSSEEEDAPQPKFARLFSGYKRNRHKSDITSSLATQYNRYLELAAEFNDTRGPNGCLQFWLTNKNTLSKLFPLAMRTLSVPASSSPIERVFSHGGIIMRPHRAKLSDKMLSNLIFLKCNSLYARK